MKRIRVRAFYTRYPHWGAYAGGHQVCRHFDPALIDASLQPVSDSDEDWPLPPNRLNTALRTQFLRRGMAWYKLSDLAAEVRALPAVATNAVDIVHFLDAEHTGQYLPGWIKRLRVSRVKTIGTFHQPPELLPDLVNRDVVAALDRILVVSPSQEAFFRSFVPPERIQTILHGIDADFFRPGGHRASSGGVLRCITVGHWMRDWAAVRAVADALAADQSIEFHVVTNRETGLAGCANVTTHRAVSDEELRGLYQAADVLFLPVVNATANNSLLEGMGCGLPVVSTDIESVRAYVGSGPAMLVERNDPRGLVHALECLRDEGRRRTLGRAARARAEALAWPRIASEWERAYAALARDK